MDYLIILLRTLLSYSILVISLRVMGKREIGQLSLFDLIILLSIADIMVIGIENYDQNYYFVLLPVVILTFLQKIVAFVLLKSAKIRKIVDGKPSMIIMNGKLVKEEMTKQAYNIEDLLLQLRTQNIFLIDDVLFAILETNGKLSVVKKDEKSILFPLPIIICGKIDYEMLSKSGKNEDWILKELGRNRLEISSVLCAFITSYGLACY